MTIHDSITPDRVQDAVEAQLYGTENPGFCIDCGADHDACEPDAQNYRCYECGRNSVFGAEIVFVWVA